MANSLSRRQIIFAIDTDGYAGNFERMMGWYITGIRPESMHGGADWIGEVTACELEKVSFDGVVRPIQVEHGGFSYVEIIPSRSEHNAEFNSVGIYLEESPAPETIKLMRERAQAFTKLKPPKGSIIWTKGIKILGFRLLEEKLVVTELPMGEA